MIQSNDNINWSLVARANLSSFSPPALLQDTYYRRVAINRQGSYSCSSTTNAILISVYDQFGNFIYNENISEPDPSINNGIMIQGWDGRNAPQSPFFIYTVEGVLYDGITTVERTGTFLLLR